MEHAILVYLAPRFGRLSLSLFDLWNLAAGPSLNWLPNATAAEQSTTLTPNIAKLPQLLHRAN